MWFLLKFEKQITSSSGMFKDYSRLKPGTMYNFRPGGRNADSAIHVRVEPWTDVENLNSRPEVILKPVNVQLYIDNHLNDLEEPRCFDGQVLRVGGSDRLYKLHWENITVVHEIKGDQEGHQRLIEVAKTYGFHVTNRIDASATTTHYYLTKNNLKKIASEPSVKLETALLLQRTIVDESFFDLLNKTDQYFRASSLFENCNPIVLEKFGPWKKQATFGKMPKRQRLFRNKVFWFFDEHQFKLYQLLVRVGGGSAKYATFEEAMNASLDNNQLFVEPPKLIEAFRPVKARYHQELDVTRCILQNEIDYAIIYCSTNILCNPDADPSEEVDNLIENATLESPESVIKREADDDIATVPYTHYNDEAPTVRAAYNEDDPTVPYEHDDTMVPIKEEKSDDYPLFDAEIIQSNEKDGLDDERKDGDLHNNVRDKLPLAERNGYRSNHSDTDTAEDEQQEGTDNNEDSPAKSGSRPIERTQDEDEELFEKTHNDDKQLIDGAADNDINSSHRIGADESAYDNDISMDEAEIDPTPQMPDDLMDMDSFFDNMFAKTNSQIEQKKKEKQRQQELKRKQQEERQRRESSERKQQEEMQRLVDEEIKRYEQEKQEQAAEYARQQQQREQDVIRDDDRNSRQRVEAELPKESVDSTMRDTEISESNENCNEQANSTQNENREQNNDAIGDRQCCIIFAPLVVNRRPPNIAAPAEAYEEGNTAINYKRFKKVKHLQEYANTIYSWTDTVTNSQLQRNRLTGIGQPRFGETRLTATEIDDDMVIRPTTNRNRRLRNM